MTPRDQEDVVQEIWVKAYRKIDRLRSDASERAWLASFARRTVQHYRRRRGRSARKIQAVDRQRDDVTNPHLRFEKLQLADAVLGQLGPDQRSAYVLVHGYGMSGAEAAEALGASVNTIYSRLRLAQKKIDRLCEASGVSAEALEAEARPEPDPRRRSRVLALVMLQIRGAESAILGTWVAFAVGAAVLVLVVVGLTARLPTHSSRDPVARASVALARVGVPEFTPEFTPEFMVDRGLVALSKTSSGGAAPLHLSGAKRPQPTGEAVQVDSSPTVSKPPESADESASIGRSPGRAADRPSATSPRPSTQSSRGAANPVVKPGIRETAAEPEPTEDENENENENENEAEADEQLAALANEVAAASTTRRAAWRSAAAAVSAQTPPASIAPETEILRDAKAAHNAGRNRDALRMLKSYDDTFPRGRLRDVATGIRVSALCERGRTRAAQKEAVALQERSPSSPINAKVRRACW